MLRGLSAKIESMQKTIGFAACYTCRINRTSQGHLKEIRDPADAQKEGYENEDLRKLSGYEEPLGTPATAALQSSKRADERRDCPSHKVPCWV